MITYQLLDDALDEVGEGQVLVALLRVPDVLGKLSNGLGIGLALKGVAFLLENQPELTVVGDDSIVDDRELVLGVRSVGVGVDTRRLAMGRPAGVGHTAVGGEGLVPVDRGLFLNELLKGSDFANLLEDQDLLLTVAIDSKAWSGK